jgi:hypothetical protein
MDSDDEAGSLATDAVTDYGSGVELDSEYYTGAEDGDFDEQGYIEEIIMQRGTEERNRVRHTARQRGHTAENTDLNVPRLDAGCRAV